MQLLGTHVGSPGMFSSGNATGDTASDWRTPDYYSSKATDMSTSSIAPCSLVSVINAQGQAHSTTEQNGALNLPPAPPPNSNHAVGSGDDADRLQTERDETRGDIQAVAPEPVAQPRARHRRNNAMIEAELARLLPPDIQMRIMPPNMPPLMPQVGPQVNLPPFVRAACSAS